MIGDEALDVYNAFTWDSADDKIKIDKVLEQFDKFCEPRKNTIYERYLFFSRGEQGWRSGESARLPPMCPGFDSRHMWAEFVGSLLCSERFFSGYSGFPLSSKTNI